MELLVQVWEEEADDERVAVLTSYLRTELLQLEVLDVTGIASNQAPLGVRGTEISAVGSLLVSLGQAADGLRSVVSAIKDWLVRGSECGRTVRLEVDGEKIELSQATAAQQESLVELFISRHSAGESHRWPDNAKP